MECRQRGLCRRMGEECGPPRCYTYISWVLGRWQVAVVWVEETPTRAASRAEPPYATTDRRRPIDLPEVAGNDGPVLLDGAAPRAGVMKFDGPAGRSSLAEKTREPLQLMVHAQTDPAGQFSATGMPSPSDCYPPGPVGLDATGGPAGPYVGGGPAGPAHCLPVLKSCKHLIPDHADLVVQHDAESDTEEMLEYEVVENILDGRPTKGITWPELLECSIRLLDSSLDGKLEKEISDWELEGSPMPEINLESGHIKRMLCSGSSEQSVPDSCLDKPVMNPVQDNDPDGQLREVKEYENQSYVEKTEQTQFSYDTGFSDQELEDSCLVARTVEDAVEEDLNHKPVMNPVQDNDPDGQLRKVKEYENQSYVEKTEETQFSYDTGLSDQELEDDIRLEVLRNRLGRQVNATDSDISMDKLRSEGWRRWNTDMDTEYQYETFNGLSVYYGGDNYDSHDSEEFWLDTPEEMDNNMRNHSRPDGGDNNSVNLVDVTPKCNMASERLESGVFNHTAEEDSDTSRTVTSDLDDTDCQMGTHMWDDTYSPVWISDPSNSAGCAGETRMSVS